ncbi:NACHT domain-containing protein [Nonomuraea sp. NPDC002799]
MRPVLSYRDAVDLLGGPARLTRALDTASSVALFGLTAIDLFDARAEAVRLADGVIGRLRDRVKGYSTYDTTQRLAAAHAVIVVSAFLEVVDEAGVLDELTRADQERLTGLDTTRLAASLLDGPMLMPTPQRPYESVLEALADHYTRITKALLGHLEGLACWDAWDETRRARLARDLPEGSVRRYGELFRRLATDFPEVGCWSATVSDQATRAGLRKIERGLAGVEERLSRLVSARGPSDRLESLIRANRAALGHPIVVADDAPPGLTIPLLERGYVDPGFRLLPPEHDRHIVSAKTWEGLPRRDDLSTFLSAHLTLPQATNAPLLVLGHPGAGKSLLTRILAARLPAGAFLPLRVELRDVPAESTVLAQIEHGVKEALDETMSWPDLVHAAQGALPVVMLDGFDELLQSTGVNRTDYLERVAQWQRYQAEKGRALAIIVTSRTAVANRARVPDDSIVLQLEPFDEGQVRRWVGIWNDGNGDYFRQQDGLEPLRVENVLAVPRLAEQPLLLFMLALYDTDRNALRLLRKEIHEAELYERLLRDFAAREVGKSGRDLTGADRKRAVEDALLQLSVTAFAMFNRNLQWVREDDLADDLRALLRWSSPTPWVSEPRQARDFRTAVTHAEGVIAGFFFVRTTRSLRENERLKAYEFLHATFGEYLVARLVVQELAHMAGHLASPGSRYHPPDESLLHALLSYATLTVGTPIVDFLEYGIAHRIQAPRRALLKRHLCELFAVSLMPRPGSAFESYQPVIAEAPARCAAYSANLLLLAVLSSAEPIPGAELFGTEQPEAANERWRRIARLWHSQLTRAGWTTLTQTVRARHFLRDGSRTMVVGRDRGEPFDLRDLIFFTWPDRFTAKTSHELMIPAHGPLSLWAREIAFRDDTLLGHLFLDLLPYAKAVDDNLEAHPGSPVTDLLMVMLNPASDVETYSRALRWDISYAYRDLVLKQLEADCHELPVNDVLALVRVAWLSRPSRVGRLERILRNLEARPDLDRDLFEETTAALTWKAQDQPGAGPRADLERPPMGERDVTGDGEP